MGNHPPTGTNKGEGSIRSRDDPHQWERAPFTAAGKSHTEPGSYHKMIPQGKGLRLRTILRWFWSWSPPGWRLCVSLYAVPNTSASWTPEEQSAWDGMKINTTSPYVFLTSYGSLYKCGFIPRQRCGVRPEAVQPPLTPDLQLQVLEVVQGKRQLLGWQGPDLLGEPVLGAAR